MDFALFSESSRLFSAKPELSVCPPISTRMEGFSFIRLISLSSSIFPASGSVKELDAN